MDEEKIEILSTDDAKIGLAGEIMSNQLARTILQLLFQNELTANEIAQKTEQSLQLVKYHINKMQELGVVRISKVGKNSKNQDMNYYTASKFAIVIVPSQVSDRTKDSKLLRRSIKTIYRLIGVGVTAAVSWALLASNKAVPVRGGPQEQSLGLEILVPLVIIAAGAIIEIIIWQKTKKDLRKTIEVDQP